MSQGPTLTDIPNEVVLDYLLPELQLSDITSLSAVNRQFNILTSDPAFWRNKTLQDFTFPSTSHPFISNSNWWKRVYLGLLKPKSYVWGSSDNNRLGGAELNNNNKRFGRFIDLPSEINWINSKQGKNKNWSESLKDSLTFAISGITSSSTQISSNQDIFGDNDAGVVDLQAGGWSFTARQSDGSIWVWGQLDGSRPGFRLHSWDDKHCPCPHPTRIPVPCQAESISAGRRHLLILDSDNLIWELRAWGRAYHHTSSELTAPTGHGINRSPPHIIQLSTGWQHSAALTARGEIHVWYPFSDSYEQSLTLIGDLNGPVFDSEENKDERALKHGKVGEGVLITLPPIPTRPVRKDILAGDTREFEAKSQREENLEMAWAEYQSTRSLKLLEEEQRVVKIASGEDFLVALKKNGEVWLTVVKDGVAPKWQYMKYFSSPTITHLTAQFRSFTTYATPIKHSSKSAVYHTRLPDRIENVENILPDQLESLQNKGIIQIAIGDYHYAALNDKGEMFTWGQGDSGQLGRGRDRLGDEPTKVIFPQDQVDLKDNEGDEQEGSFVFSITAGGWHTGALVLGDLKSRKIPLEKQTKEIHNIEEDQEEESESGNWPRGLWNPFANNPNPAVPPTGPSNRGGGPVRAMPFYRVGFAGRGANLVGAGRGYSSAASDGQAQDHSEGQAVLRGAAPIVRVGFAGRGANVTGRGRVSGNSESEDEGS
ncbi:uncharacterized protein I206_103224 [Kwoniella pini CBS 10737]|uniref:SCF-associated factor 1 n=1 Tax=Kwoniella pini CBS 10737 TaxID=1296096 RepID=A0AAJ8MMU6_9TREE